jgi:hypothetical protein
MGESPKTWSKIAIPVGIVLLVIGFAILTYRVRTPVHGEAIAASDPLTNVEFGAFIVGFVLIGLGVFGLRQRGVTNMVSERTLHFTGKNKDLSVLSQQVAHHLSSEGYKTQSTAAPLGIVIQAKKAGILRDILAADRAFSILIAGKPNDFTIHVGIGKWVENIAVAAVETILLTWLFLAVDVPEMLWTEEVEKKIIKEIIRIVG